MRIVVNGEGRDAAEGSRLQDLLTALGLDRAAIVVEHNGRVVEREGLASVALREGDRLEIVRFVGGG